MKWFRYQTIASNLGRHEGERVDSGEEEASSEADDEQQDTAENCARNEHHQLGVSQSRCGG